MKQSVSRLGLFSIAVCGVVIGGVAYFVADSSGNANETQLGETNDWSQLNVSMHRMHMAMAAIEQSGNTDADFVRLMIPHHQGAIEMAKVGAGNHHRPAVGDRVDAALAERTLLCSNQTEHTGYWRS